MRASSRLPPPRPLRADRPQRAPPGGEERMCPANAVRRAGRHRKDGIAGPISVRRGRRDFGNPAVRNRTGRASPRRPRPFEMSRKPTRRPPVRTICEFRFGVRPPLRTAGKRCAGKSCRKGPEKDAPEPAPRQCGRKSRCCAKTRQRTPKPTEPRQVRRQELPEGIGKGCAGTHTAAMRPGKPMLRRDTTTHPETHRTETKVRRQELPEGAGKGCAGTRTAAMRPGKPMPRKDTTTHPETHRTETKVRRQELPEGAGKGCTGTRTAAMRPGKPMPRKDTTTHPETHRTETKVRRQELPEGAGKGCTGTRTAAMRPGKPMPRKDTTTHPETHRTETGAPPRQSLRAAEIRPVGRRRKRTRIAPPEGRKRTLRPAKRTALL